MVDLSIQTRFMQFLRSRSTAVVSTISSNGQPMAATIYFAVDDIYNFYFTTKNFTRKFKNLEKNAKIALVVGTENEPVTAQIEGRAERVAEGKEFDARLEALQKVMFKNTFVAPMFQLAPDKSKLVMYKIVPNWIRWLDLRGDNVNGDFIQIL